MSKKTVIITGATSGFGLLTTKLLLERGHTVIAAVRGGSERMAGLLTHANLRGMSLDLEDPKSIQSFAQELGEQPIHTLINNAGYGLMGPMTETSPEELHKQMQINFSGPVELTRLLLPSLKKTKGRVIHVSSIAGLVYFPFYGSYNASKFSLEAHAEALDFEFRPFGMDVALVEPGGFKTNFIDSIIRPSSTVSEDNPFYEPMRRFQEFALEKSKSFVSDPIKVAKVMVKLTESPTVPFRTLVGQDAHLLYYLHRFLPKFLWRRGLGWFFARVIYG